VGVNKPALIKFLNERGWVEISDSMDRYIELWKSWSRGSVDGFHDYRVWNGKKSIECRRASLQLGKSSTEQWANLLFNEKCEIAVDDGASSMEAEGSGVSGVNPTDQFVKMVFDQNDLYVKINECQEKKATLGTVAYIPYYSGDRIRMNYITADNMIPLSWENGIINELCVYSSSIVGSEEYLFVQLFVLDSDTGSNDPRYVIENLLLHGERGVSGGSNAKAFSYAEMADINAVRGYEKIEKRVETNSARRPFVIDRLNILNNCDPDSPLGVSVFANAIDTMRLCDVIFDSYQNEFVLGKKRVMVAAEAINIETGEQVFHPNELVFYQLPKGAGIEDKPFIQEMDMSIRATEHEQALQNALNTFSYQCGMGDNYFRYNAGAVATATQVMSEQNVMFRTLKKHEIILESALVDLVRLIIEIGVRYNLAPGLNPDAEITVKFDDSIIEDKDKEFQRRMAMVAARMYKPEAFVAWHLGITMDEAKNLMPAMPIGDGEEGIQ